MAKESVWQRRARKCRSAKAEYYPKVNLAEPASEAEQASPPPESLDLAAATPLVAAQTTSEPEGALRLPDCLDLLAATPLARALLERRGAPIVLDGSAVHQLGAQCVQVLLSAKRTWDADGVPLSIVNCAPRMIEDLQLLGIDSATLTSGEQPQ
jgi:chemotaxis protein CheX